MILWYLSKNKKDHEKHVRLVLEIFWEQGLYTKLEKYLFHQTEKGFIATTEELKMDMKKVETIVSWEVPQMVRNVQHIHGFANFYQILIKKHSLR